MQPIPRSIRRLALFLLSLPLVALALAVLYQAGMARLEHVPRTLGESMQWAVATMTTTGFGPDTTWSHPVMAAFVIVAEFVGVTMIFLIFPVFIIPLLEERFQARLPSTIPPLDGDVFIYRYGPAVTSLLDELERANVGTVIFEEDEAVARRLHEQGHRVLLGSMEDDDPDLQNLVHARAVVANGDDEENAAMALSARYHGFTGPILAMVDNPARRTAMLRAGATTAFTPTHVLAAAIAARVSHRLSPRISGVRHLGAHLDVAELRIHASSALAGHSIRESNVRSRSGATIVGLWLKLVATSPGTRVGQRLATRVIREKTGCSVAAVERDDVVHVEFDGSFRLESKDVVYLCGTSVTLARYFREFPGTRTLTRSQSGDSLAWMTEERPSNDGRVAGTLRRTS